jgi:hypothetical protein
MRSAARSSALLFALGLGPFVVLCTANSAGYRYGASDLAFYAPAVMQRLDPRLFPRDAPLIDAQARLTLMDETVAAAARVTRLPLPQLFAAVYAVTLGLLAWAAVRVGGALYAQGWTVVALLVALTLRHAIPQTGANSLEGYFHPRQLAFAFGALAAAAFLRRRYGAVALYLAGAAALHPTTTLWFSIWLAVAVFVAEPRWRRSLAVALAAAAGVGGWAAIGGPLSHRLTRMDAAWLATLADKDYLFPLEWPGWVWLVNLGYVVAIVAVHRWRSAAGRVVERETALAIGCLTLAAVFAASLPFNAARVALAVQLQPARVFWMLDFLAVAYLVWALAEGPGASFRRAQAIAAVLLIASLARGTYIMRVLFPDRPLAQVDVPDDDWGRVMRWARTGERSAGWLADPFHAAAYGTSVRVAGERDVFVEAIKDAALGMYDREIAMRTRDRMAALGEFSALTPARARELGEAYGLTYLVADRPLALPVAFASGPLRVYHLGSGLAFDLFARPDPRRDARLGSGLALDGGGARHR